MIKYVFALSLLTTFSFAQAEEIPIWPGDAPGTKGRSNEEYVNNERIYKVFQPSLTVHLPPRELSTGAAVLVCPGGGYDHITVFKEGHHVASWLNSLGISAFVLKYRLDTKEALEDAVQSMKLIHENAAQWGIDPEKLGMMGFSAGGHLLLNTVIHCAPDNKPDFLIPIYPGIGDIDLEGQFSANATSTFIVTASDDRTTPPENAIRIYQSLRSKNVPAELHIYNTGGHGFGLGNGRGPVADWPKRCEVWLRRLGYLEIINAN